MFVGIIQQSALRIMMMDFLTLFMWMLDMILRVYADIEAYWPKLKVGGIMAGHDYVTQDDGPEQGGQDWTTNFDGTKDETRTVVKGAVDAFAALVCRQVTVSYREDSWNSWAMRK
jgi:hypothetical protein